MRICVDTFDGHSRVVPIFIEQTHANSFSYIPSFHVNHPIASLSSSLLDRPNGTDRYVRIPTSARMARATSIPACPVPHPHWRVSPSERRLHRRLPSFQGEALQRTGTDRILSRAGRTVFAFHPTLGTEPNESRRTGRPLEDFLHASRE